MSVFKNKLIIEWGKNQKAFLDLAAGVVRGPLPGYGSRAGEAPAARPARKAAPQKAPAPAIAGDGVGAVDPEKTAREYVGSGLPAVGLLDVLPDLDETVSTHGLPANRMLATEMVLLKALAARSPGCRYLQIGSWRGSGTANVAEVAQDCISVSLEGEGHESVFPASSVAERGAYREETGSVAYGPCAFDYASFRDYFDLVFVDRCGSREAAKAATEAAFDLLRDSPDSAIVWRGNESAPGHTDWPVLAGILDGRPGERAGNLYHVSDTSCVLWSNRELPAVGEEDALRPDKRFEVRFTARDATRKLVVLDDGFPSLRSPFRVAEYNAYLEQWKDAAVYSNARIFRALGEVGSFAEVLEGYAGLYPELGSRVLKLPPEINLDGDLAYCLFLNNTSRFLPLIEENDAPFVFTLYPGGGFQLDQKGSDEMLSRVCSSPNFSKVIATQKVTRDYLLDRGFCGPEEVEFVYGGVFPSVQLARYAAPRNEYKRDKDTFDVCFVAYKYKAESIKSKGYDMFVETAKRLAKTHEDVVFHVVGTFDEPDLDVSEIGAKIRFHGPLATESFPAFYANMDIILSPTAPFTLQPGAFDGFPTGACIEAGLCGVAVFSSDPLEQNVAFEDGEEIVVVPRDARSISETIDHYYNNYDALRRLAGKGQEAFDRVFDLQAQLEPRLRILSELLGEAHLDGG